LIKTVASSKTGIQQHQLINKAHEMLALLRSNLKFLIFASLFFIVVLGGIYYVEAALEAQVQVVE